MNLREHLCISTVQCLIINDFVMNTFLLVTSNHEFSGRMDNNSEECVWKLHSHVIVLSSRIWGSNFVSVNRPAVEII